MKALETPPRLLVVAQSGRMLAQMLRHAGYEPVVVDCFADADTCQLAVETVRVADLGVGSLRGVVADLCARHDIRQVVYGSGFEGYADSLDYLQQGWQLLGNTAEVFRRLQDKAEFFQLLTALDIPFPETVFAPPAEAEGWLQKPVQGQGGCGIVRYQLGGQSGALAAHYWQREVTGLPLSLTFCAAAEWVEVLGFNRQWTRQQGLECFRFAGLVNQAVIAGEHQQLVCDWLIRLAAATGLRGLGSLDFIWRDGGGYVLEINARAPASAQLYELDAVPVFARHLQALHSADTAVATSLPVCHKVDGGQFKPAGYQPLYAAESTRIPEAMCWPEWVVDRPPGGAIIGKGQPICSIIASENEPALVRKLLLQRRRFIEKLLITGS